MTWKELLASLGPLGATALLLLAGIQQQDNRELAGVFVALGCVAFGAWLITTGHLILRHKKRDRDE